MAIHFHVDEVDRLLTDLWNPKAPSTNPSVAVLWLPALPSSRDPEPPIWKDSKTRNRMLKMMQGCTDQLLGSPDFGFNYFWVDPKFFYTANTTNIMTSISQNITHFQHAKYIVVMDPWLYDFTPLNASGYEKLLRVRFSEWIDSVPSIIALQQSAQVASENLMFLFSNGDPSQSSNPISGYVINSLASLLGCLTDLPRDATLQSTSEQVQGTFLQDILRHQVVPGTHLAIKKLPILVALSDDVLGLPQSPAGTRSSLEERYASEYIPRFRRDLSYLCAQKRRQASAQRLSAGSPWDAILHFFRVLRIAILTLSRFRVFLRVGEIRQVRDVYQMMYDVYGSEVDPVRRDEGLVAVRTIAGKFRAVSWQGEVESDVSIEELPKEETDKIMEGVERRLQRIRSMILERCGLTR